ncbi:MAG: hypothetical protein OK474_00600 [Thaumarchaeota archaeon]|nr:hypothetical protein [Nitrososphaerota archaeon]
MFDLGTLTDAGGIASLLLITASFIVLALAARRIRVLRSFQVEMFVFAVVLFAAESPHIFSTLGLINVSSFEAAGLALHSVSMVILAGFVAFRVLGFLKRK